MKVCTACGETKPLTEFYRWKYGADGRFPQCKLCRQDQVREYGRTERGRQVLVNSKLKRKYGLTLEDFKALSGWQGDRCAICERSETAPDYRTGSTRALSVDHDHGTGELRGLLCGACNTALGLLDHDEDRLLRAIAYLRYYRAPLPTIARPA